MCRRKEVDGTGGNRTEIHWKILPLHSAIVLHAPVKVIKALINAYPQSTRIGDGKKMLPLHSAFRYGSSLEIVAVLVDAYPDAVTIKDGKGHTPLHVLKAYRKKYQKENKIGKISTKIADKNRKDLITLYLGKIQGSRQVGIQSVQDDGIGAIGGILQAKSSKGKPPVPSFDYDSDTDSDLSDNSDDDEYENPLVNYGKAALDGFFNLRFAVRDSMQCQ